MESPGIIPTVLTGMGIVAAVLLGVWGIVARYDDRVRNRMDALRDQMDGLRDRSDGHRDRIDAQG